MAWYRCGGGGIPSSLKGDMNDVFNKKFGTVLQDYPPEDWPGTVNLMGPLPERTVSGAVVTFPDGADAVKLKSCAVTIAPNLDGVSSVDVVQTGLQMLPVTIPTNGSGITYTDNGDGTFNARGQASSTISNRYVFTSTDMNKLKRGETYYISGCPSGGASNTYKLQVWNASTSSQLGVDYGNGGSFTMPTEGTINVRFVIYSGQNVDFTVKPMITAAQTTEHEQYHATTHTATLGRTIYGGSVDVVNGTGTDNCKRVTLGDLTWIKSGTAGLFYCQTLTDMWYPETGGITRYGDFISDKFNEVKTTLADDDITCYFNTNYSGYRVFIMRSDFADKTSAQFKTWLQGYDAHLVYKVNDATAEDFTFTAVPIISRLGDNTMWGDGDLSVTYRRDIDLALAQ